MSNWVVAHLWLIPVVPLVASLAILGLLHARRAAAAGLAIAGQVVALLLSLAAFAAALPTPGYRAFHNFTWFNFGEQALRLGFVLDPLAAVMLVMITLVSLCIFVFSVGYMATDRNFSRFFAYLSFFSAAMLGVVIANSLLLLFVCWELVGLASYLLIGFWIHKPSAAAAAKKAFITTRIGDIGFFLGMLWLYGRSGTLLFYDGGNGALENAGLVSLGASATFVALLIFCGAVGKSGQFPLHVWLPDAMEGPTPVSALIHAATMVAAGVFLVARVYPIFSLGAINGVTPSLVVVVWIGVITALIAAFIALAQADIKRILAYSTVSQLGLMMVSLGVGGVAAGIMHLLAHGFFKALLFLGSGSVIHGCHEEQDIRQMGGLRGLMPVTFLTYAVGMMALSGVPLFFAGAWTKEDILHATSLWSVSRVPYYLMLLGVVLTALYMTRQMIYVFFGQRRAAAEHAHESPAVMTWPLIVLALCTIAFSLVLTPAWPWLHDFLLGENALLNLGLLIQPGLYLALILVALGIGLGLLFYRGVGEIDPLERAAPPLFRFLENGMWFDEFYDGTILALARFAAQLSDFLDRYLWDGLVRMFGGLGQLFGSLTKNFDERGINAGVDDATGVARGFGRLVSIRHSGQIQAYLGAIAFGLLALLIFYAWLS
ncbi:MAG TPA: NADH-quinone oxidoreductase subunit L [Chthoniobacterales bacterium]|jgi:NADH-quinone oxidoreductase subunit L|nr:NADH-quinone oxidoreductase subunit L [Chthoniobacterales bacterium]